MEEEVGVTVPAYLNLQTKFCFGQPTFKKRDKQHKWQGNTFPLKNTERKEDKTPKSVCPGVEQRQHHSCTCHVKTNTKWRYAGNCTGKFLWDIKKKPKKTQHAKTITASKAEKKSIYSWLKLTIATGPQIHFCKVHGYSLLEAWRAGNWKLLKTVNWFA